MRGSLKAMVLAGAGAWSVGAAAPAIAQQTAQATFGGLEEIVVTARRREENIQQVPVAISALGTEEIRERNMTNQYDLAKAVPAFNPRGTARGPTTGSTSTRRLALRGLTGTQAYFAEAPGQGYSFGNFLDLQNVQVLKGPQGTLFGVNATGGALLFEPKRPSLDQVEGYIDGTLARFDHRILEGALNVPVFTDKIAFRIAGRREVRDGLTEVISTGQRIDNTDTWAWRAAMTVKLSDSLENYAVYGGTYTNQTQAGFTLLSVNPVLQNTVGALRNAGLLPQTGPRSMTLTEIAAQVALQKQLGPRKIFGLDMPDSWTMEHRHFFVDVLSYEITDKLRVKNIASLSRLANGFRFDPDGTQMPIYGVGPIEDIRARANNKKTWTRDYSEELQLQGTGMLDGKLVWTVGGFLSYSEPESPKLMQPAGCTFTFGLTRCNGNAGSDNRSRTQSLFGQGTYDLGGLSPSLDGLNLTAGLRYNWDMQSAWSRSFAANNVTCLQAVQDSNCIRELHGDWKALSYTFAIDYQLTPDVLIYVTHRKGYSSGGFNATLADPARQVFNPEYNRDIDFGAKADWQIAGVTGRSNISLFRNSYTNIQRAVALPAAAGGTTTGTFNAAKAVVQGFDRDLTVRPVEPLTITFNAAYLDSYYKEYFDALEGDISWHAFQNAPKWQYTVGFRYNLPLDEKLGRLTFTWNSNYKGRDYSDGAILSPQEFTPPQETTDIRLDWHNVMGYSLDAALFVRNLFDTDYQTGAFFTYNTRQSLLFNSATWGDPRVYGIQIRYRLGD